MNMEVSFVDFRPSVGNRLPWAPCWGRTEQNDMGYGRFLPRPSAQVSRPCLPPKRPQSANYPQWITRSPLVACKIAARLIRSNIIHSLLSRRPLHLAHGHINIRPPAISPKLQELSRRKGCCTVQSTSSGAWTPLVKGIFFRSWWIQSLCHFAYSRWSVREEKRINPDLHHYLHQYHHQYHHRYLIIQPYPHTHWHYGILWEA